MGNRMKEIRESKGISQVQLAKMSGVSRGTIISIENNKSDMTTTRTLSKLAKALGTSVANIFFADDVQHLNT